ncbi:hypothetical protein DL96DRAFT_672456 [Flagelloscypha sp. PMI_526]|nr:hypothetical protein DL96DRAFT_672456 [Flagelloscypha sp. PMI_526]
MTYDLDSDDEGSIPWAMTQAIPSKPRSPFPPTDMPPPHLKGSDLRKYLIQKALEEKHGSSASKPAPVLARASSTTKAPLSPSRTNNSLKRPNPNGSSSVAPDAPPKKRRSLPPKVSPDQSPPPNSESPQPESSPSEGAQKVKKLSPAAMQAALDNSVYTRSSHQDAKRTKKGVPKIFLSLEQKHVLDIAKEGKSLFYTGSAGTGKSVVLKEMITTLRKKYAKWPNAVAITASTGIAGKLNAFSLI